MNRTSLVYSFLIIVVFASTLILLSSHGKSSRRFVSKPVLFGDKSPKIVVAEEPREIYHIWKNAGIHGRIVLHFNGFMNIRSLEGIKMDIVRGHYPGLLESIIKDPGSALENENFMLFAIVDNIVRKLVGVVPESRYSRIGEELLESRYELYGELYRGVVEGSPKIVTTLKYLYPIDEPVLMNFDVGFFSSSDILPEELFEMLNRLKIKTDLVTFSFFEGKRHGTSEGKEKMMRFIQLLKGL